MEASSPPQSSLITNAFASASLKSGASSAFASISGGVPSISGLGLGSGLSIVLELVQCIIVCKIAENQEKKGKFCWILFSKVAKNEYLFPFCLFHADASSLLYQMMNALATNIS